MRYPTRESEFDHRRLQVPALTPARSIAQTLKPEWQQEGDQLRAQRLTRDIRVLWRKAVVRIWMLYLATFRWLDLAQTSSRGIGTTGIAPRPSSDWALRATSIDCGVVRDEIELIPDTRKRKYHA